MSEWKKLVDEVHAYTLPKVSDDFKKLFDSDIATDSKRSLVVVFKSTHAGRKTRNDTFYPPAHVKSAVPTWTKDYNKPVLKDHGGGPFSSQLPSDITIGRVVSARYVDTSAVLSAQQQDSYKSVLRDSVDSESLAAINNVVDLQDTGVDWDGLGYDELVLEITEPDAIKKFLRGEIITGSSGKSPTTVYCSVCGKDFFKDGMCEHERSKRYDITDKDGKVIGNRKCVWISGPYVNDEFSITPTPANEKAVKVSQNLTVKDSVELYIWEEEANILNRWDDTAKNLLTQGMTLNDALLPEAKKAAVDPDEDEDVTMENINEKIIAYAGTLDGEDEDYNGEYYCEECEGEEEETEDAKKEKPQDKPGGSNVGKYKTGPFCGPSGGAPKGSYPVNTRKRAKAALALARHAPNPEGIKACVYRHWPDLKSGGEKGKKKDTMENIPDILKDKYSDWVPEDLELLADRIRGADSKEHGLLMLEAEDDVYNTQIAAIKYDKHIKPLLEQMIVDVKATKTLDGVELSDADVLVVVEGIEKAILAETARLRLTKRHCVSGLRQLPVVDKYHSLALKQLAECPEFSVSTKDRFLTEVVRLEKALGLIAPKKVDVVEAEPQTYEDVYNSLTDKAKILVNSKIASEVDAIKNSNDYVSAAVYNKLKSDTEAAITSLNANVESLTVSLGAEKVLKDNAIRENKLFTKRLAEKQSEMIDFLVDSIIDLKMVNGDQFDHDTYTNELLERTVDSLQDQLRDLRKIIRDEFSKTLEVSNTDGGNTITERIENIPPARLRYLNTVRLKLDKEKAKEE